MPEELQLKKRSCEEISSHTEQDCDLSYQEEKILENINQALQYRQGNEDREFITMAFEFFQELEKKVHITQVKQELQSLQKSVDTTQNQSDPLIKKEKEIEKEEQTKNIKKNNTIQKTQNKKPHHNQRIGYNKADINAKLQNNTNIDKTKATNRIEQAYSKGLQLLIDVYQPPIDTVVLLIQKQQGNFDVQTYRNIAIDTREMNDLAQDTDLPLQHLLSKPHSYTNSLGEYLNTRQRYKRNQTAEDIQLYQQAHIVRPGLDVQQTIDRLTKTVSEIQGIHTEQTVAILQEIIEQSRLEGTQRHWPMFQCITHNRLLYIQEAHSQKAKRNGLHNLISSRISYSKAKDIRLGYSQEEINKQVFENYTGTEHIPGMSNAQGTINSISMVAQEQEIATIQALLAHKKDKDFTLCLVYENQQTKEHILQKLPIIYHKQIQWILTEEGKYISGKGLRIRDGALTLQDGSILETNDFGKTNEKTYYESIGLRQENKVQQHHLVFQGGNVRQTNNTAYIGYDDIIANLQKAYGTNEYLYGRMFGQKEATPYTQEQLDTVIERFEKRLHKDIRIIGIKGKYNTTTQKHSYDIQSIPSHKQPVYHIDLFFTPINEDTIAISQIQNIESQTKNIQKQHKRIEDIAKHYEKGGKKVIRIPMRHQVEDPVVNDVIVSHNVLIGYNNALVETSKDHNGKDTTTVYIPSYTTHMRIAELIEQKSELYYTDIHADISYDEVMRALENNLTI